MRPEICEKGGHKDETQLARCLFLKLRDGDSLHDYIDFWCFRFSIKKKEKKEKTQKAWEIIFSLSFLGRLILFHLTTAFNVTKVLRAQLYLLSASRASEFWPRANPWTGSDAGFQQLPWNSLLKSWPTTVGLRHLRSELLFFCFRTIVFKKCLLPCVLKQYLRDCFTQGRRALNQVINSD